jgi:hypothetical protein
MVLMECKDVLDIPLKTWSNEVRSGDLVGQGFGSTGPIHSPANWSSKELSHFPMTLPLTEIVSSPADCPPSAAATTISPTCQDSTYNGGLSSKEE